MNFRSLCLAVGGVLSCASFAVAGDRPYPFEQIQLDNGLKVISLEDFSCPIIAVQVWYHVGAKDEEPKRQGFAHMFEHMMFRGTDRLGPEEHFDQIRRVGGNCNAYTAFDQTVYVQTVPSNQLELVLWLEAERMAFLKIDDENFFTERKVVCEELRQGHNQPYGRVPEKLLAEIYADKPYGWTPGGQIEHLLAASADELGAFWDKFYVPNNAVLVVTGAVKHADVQALAKKCFGWMPRCPDPKHAEVPPSDQKKSKTITLKEDKGPLPVLGVVYRTVPETHPDALPLEILMGVLGGGESSRLYVDVVKEQKIAQVAMAAAVGLEGDGLVGAGGALLPMTSKQKQLMQTIRKHIKRIIDEPISQAELDKMKNQLRRGEIEGAVTVANKASLLGQYAVLYGDTERINRRLAEIDAVTAEDVQRAAKKYLKQDKRINVSIEPSVSGIVGGLFGGKEGEEGGSELPTTRTGENHIAPRTGPKADAKRPDDFPVKPPAAGMLDKMPDTAHQDKTISNGLKVVVVQNHEVPMVWFMLGLKGGSWTEDKPGVADRTMDMLTKGTKSRTAKQLAETLESNAIRLSGSAGMDTSSISLSAMLPQLDLAIELFTDVLENPTFPKEEFDILQQQARMGLLVQVKTPEYLADRELRRQMYGSHPYSRTSSGELEDIDNLQTDNLKAWWAKNLRPDNAVLYVAGDITPDAAYKLVEKHLAGWKAEGKLELPKLPDPPAKQKTHIYIVDKPDSTQSQIRAGHLGIKRDHPRYIISRVLSDIFGGSFNSRLNKAIRVEKGLTYGAHGGLSPRRFGGDFGVGTFTKTESTAETVQTIIDEITKIRSAPPGDEELSDTKTYIAGSFAGNRETPMSIVGDLWMIETQNLPNDYLQKLLAGVKAAEGPQITESAKELIDPDHLVFVIVGEASKIKAKLEKIAPVTVISQAPAEGEEKPSTAPPADAPAASQPAPKKKAA